MENEFQNVMAQKSSEDLVRIATIDRFAYQDLAVEAAKNEILVRNIDTAEIEEIKEELVAKNSPIIDNRLPKAIEIYVLSLLVEQNKSTKQVIYLLDEEGVEAENAVAIVNYLSKRTKSQKREAANRDMTFGALWCAGGIVATVADIGYIFWGAIVFGAIQFFKGLIKFSQS